MLFMLIENVNGGHLFYLDGSGVFHRGDLYGLIYVTSFFYVILASLHALIEGIWGRDLSKRRFFLVLASFPLFPAVAGLIQNFWPWIPLADPSLTLAALIMYINATEEMISIDPLTQMSNRKQFLRNLQRKMENHAASTELYLLMMDLDSFKKINDTYGHLEGDDALRIVGDVLKRIGAGTRHTTFARYGGDEFIALIETADPRDVDMLRDKIKTMIGYEGKRLGKDYRLKISIGIAAGQEAKNIHAFIKLADDRLYAEKTEVHRKSNTE
jgi:diguanylate cyclase (GGDEF)-like protein